MESTVPVTVAMRVVFLISQLYKHGGVEKVLTEKANFLAERGIEVFIITFEQRQNPAVYSLDSGVKTVDLGVDYHRNKSFYHPSNLLRSVVHFFRLRRLLHQVKPDYVINCSFSFDFYFLPFIYRKSKKIKEYHASRAVVNPDSRRLKVDQFVESFYDKILVLNPSEKKYYRNRQIVVVPNPVKIVKEKSRLEAHRAIAVGRIAPVKNFEFLIQCWSRFIADHPDWELHIYGEDYLDTQRRLQEQCLNLGIESQIRFMGQTDDIFKTLCDYSMTLMTSHTECFPMILLESLSAGVPVISVDCPTGPGHIIENGNNGFLVPAKSENEFVDKLKTLANNSGLRKELGKGAEETAVNKFNLNRIMQDWMDQVLK
jgi:glycosyltransferase involved in cell wall biosynthesis